MKLWLKIVLGVVVVTGVAVGYFFYHQAQKQGVTLVKNSAGTVTTTGNPKDNEFARGFSQGKCQGSGTVEFTHSPMDIGDIGAIQPYGTMVGAHVIPTSHGYFAPLDFHGPRDQYPVYAIADGFIVSISHRGESVGDGPKTAHDEYQMQFEHTCTFWSYYDLLTSLSPDLAGQLVGRVGGQTVDFGVWNFAKDPAFFANPESYKGDENRFYLDDMYKYFAEPLKTELLAKSARVAEPKSGRVDYDIAGKLVGNWFKEGSGGFSGPPNTQQTSDRRYWDGHLSISYDYVDPTQIRFSIGNYNSQAAQFSVKGNTPDPKDVGVETGLIKYELVNAGYINGDTGEPWMLAPPIAKPQLKANGPVKGTALLQMTDANTLKLELFPGKTADAVSQFTSAALIYKR